jgi:hypothetical protein
MNALDQLNAYLRRLEGRLRWSALSKGTSLVTVSALLVTVVLVWITNRYAFSPSSLVVARILLFLSVATAIAFGLVIPLLDLNRRNAARRAEQKFPDFQERLLTIAEKQNTNDPFVQLLASDAMRVAQESQPDRLAPTAPILGFLTSAGLAVAVLLWLILAGPGYLGYGTSLLWAGAPKSGNTHAFYDIAIKPGDRTIRRKADQLVTAQLLGFEAPRVRLFARYQGATKWEPVDMLPSQGASTYEFLFSALATNVEYYVEAGAVQSKHYNLRVIDMPSIKKTRVTYHYPAWTGMKDSVEEIPAPGADLRAVEGTEAEVAIQTDRPLSKGILMVNDDQQIELKGGEGNWISARVPITKDGMYHIAAIEQGENVRMSEDFFIEARKTLAPTVRIDRPGRDARVNPVEEVTVTVSGAADFGLNDLDLHYSVNAGPEKTVSLLKEKGAKSADGKYVIALEDYKLSPGDLVTIYATARDARSTTKTDMYFIQTDPFERNYSQSQEAGGGGGGGGGGDPTGEISQRQKDIIAATWNEQKSGAKKPSESADDARFLADQEEKLAQQALSLANRMKARELSDANSQFKNFASEMEGAAKAMTDSAQRIRTQKWNDAMPPEQEALQHALRAESMFRDIQVAFGNQGGGGGGGGMGRDLQNLADLELDREKNQYESGSQSSSDQRAKEIDQALQKLQDLARRQQELAQQQRNQQQAFQQRWEQEMLRREAEELKRQMQQLQQQQGQQQGQQSNQQGQQSGQQANGQQSANGQPGSQGSSGQAGSTAGPQLQRAIERLERATQDMQNAENQQNASPEQTRLNQERAAKGLQESRDLLNGMQNQNAAGQIDKMVQQANELAGHQSDFQNRLRRMLGGSDPNQLERQSRAMAAEGQQMADQLKQLEKQMSDTAHSLAGSQNPTSNKLREGLSEAQQTELEMNMRRNAQWIGQGYGPQVWIRESTVTAGVNQLRDKIQEAQTALAQNGQQPGKQPGGDQADLEKALAQIEAARSRLQQSMQGREQNGQRPGDGRNGNQGRQGQQPGQQEQQAGQQQGGQQPGQSQAQNGNGQQPGQQQGGQQPGGQQGGQQAGGQQGGQSGNGAQAGGLGGWGGAYGGPGPVQPYNGWVPLDQANRESQRDLNGLRDFMRNNPDFASDYLNLMHAINGAYQDKGELEGRISREVLPNMERLELELRRKLDEKNGDQVRSAGTETIPPGYSDAVADYFRKLSKGK